MLAHGGGCAAIADHQACDDDGDGARQVVSQNVDALCQCISASHTGEGDQNFDGVLINPCQHTHGDPASDAAQDRAANRIHDEQLDDV